MEFVFSLHNINEVAKSCWQIVSEANPGMSGSVLAFHGQMGAGKTTFIHALCDVRGVKDVVGSPTFSIINEYVFIENGQEKKIYHIDLYRLRDEEEALQAGVEDCLYSDHVCLVEWPEKAPGIFPENTIHIYIEAVDTQTRQLRIEANG
jgi:tRNA threonylcarbamoyladenosine biosynthesis protein TsaE